MNCRMELECEKLWCRTYNEEGREMCATRHQPWADGTKCGRGFECFHQKCVNPLYKKNQNFNSIDGGWTSWSDWSS